MRIEDEAFQARGYVNPAWIDVSTGRRFSFGERHNTLSYMSAEAMASAFGGDPSYIPARIGFIYGTLDDVADFDRSREQSYEGLLQDIMDMKGPATTDVAGLQIVEFSYSPTLNVVDDGKTADTNGDSDSTSDDGVEVSTPVKKIQAGVKYANGNAVTFHAVSNSSDSFQAGKFIYQAVLLGYDGKKHYVISRVSLKPTTVASSEKYLRKPTGFEVALDWTIVFK